MEMGSNSEADDRIVVGYFANGVDASRAIDELMDEGFQPGEIGAAFRTPRNGMEVSDGGRPRGAIGENPALSGSVGGPASHDEAVTPAGLAPGSGNAFPGPSRPGPIPGGEIPTTLRHDLPHDLPSTLRSEAGESRLDPMREAPGDSTGKRERSMKFGTGEGHLFGDFDYSEVSFENSFVGMGLGVRDARSLSGELGRGGAVVSVAPGSRASLAEGIIERNHGRVRFESIAGCGEACEGNRVEIYGRMRNYYRPEEGYRRKAS